MYSVPLGKEWLFKKSDQILKDFRILEFYHLGQKEL